MQNKHLQHRKPVI